MTDIVEEFCLAGGEVVGHGEDQGRGSVVGGGFGERDGFIEGGIGDADEDGEGGWGDLAG